jgi:hypothetical protein
VTVQLEGGLTAVHDRLMALEEVAAAVRLATADGACIHPAHMRKGAQGMSVSIAKPPALYES